MTEFSKPSSRQTTRALDFLVIQSHRSSPTPPICTTGGVQLELLKGKVFVFSMSCFIITLRQIEEHFITFRANEEAEREGESSKKFYWGPQTTLRVEVLIPTTSDCGASPYQRWACCGRIDLTTNIPVSSELTTDKSLCSLLVCLRFSKSDRC